MKVVIRMKIKKWLFIIIHVIFAIILATQIIQATQTRTAEPGSQEDPIVTKSYVDAAVDDHVLAIEQLQLLCNSLEDEMEKMKGQLSEDKSNAFQIVTVEAGYRLYAGNGTELVLRAGNAVALAGKSGGLADTTSGKDLAGNTKIAPNHLLIAASNDGRGAKALSKCWFLVRGSSRLEEPSAPSSENQPESPDQTGTVKATLLNVRSRPDTASPVLARLKKGDTVRVLSVSGDWYGIELQNGIKGWVMGEYVTITK